VICNEHTQLKVIQKQPAIESILNQNENFEFQQMIDLAYIETNGYLLEILMNKYKLLDHFNALRRYLLLGQGDFIRHLMDLMEYVYRSCL
jgi:gamma-tubulin complex component 3